MENEKTGGKSSKKRRQREQLLAALLQQPSLEKAAASIGMSRSTAYRIQRTPEFRDEYRNARHEIVAQSGARLQQAANAAAAVLLRVMTDDKTPASTRVRAAAHVLEQAAKFLDSEVLDKRIEVLEVALKERGIDYNDAGDGGGS